jgi:hypothetical protein
LKSNRTSSIVRTVIVVMTLLGWFVLSNHCALGRIAQAGQAKKEHACCHNGEPKQENAPLDRNSGVQCCRSLHVIMPDGVKADLSPPIVLLAVLDDWLPVEDQAVEVTLQSCDTGPPPRAVSFSELVLHRSLRSHAPPFLA